MNKEICEKGKIVINRCLEKGYSIEPLKLQQLLILMHGVSLAKFNKPFFEEPVLATNYGLALEGIEEEFGEYSLGFQERFQEQLVLEIDEQAILESIILEFGIFDASSLRKMYMLNVLEKACFQNGKKIIVPNEFIREVFVDYGFGEKQEPIKVENSTSNGKFIDFSQKYANLWCRFSPKTWPIDFETGERLPEHDLAQLAGRICENGFIEQCCLSDEDVKQIRLIRNYRQNYLDK